MTNAHTEDAAGEHKAEELEAIIVNPDDVIEMMRRNKRDEDEQRSHVLRVTPPLKGERVASPYVHQEGNYYPPEMPVEPIHINATLLFEGRIDAQLDDMLRHPSWDEVRGLFRDEHGIEYGESIDGEDEDEFDEWWDTAVEVWEDEVRAAMRDSATIQLGGYSAEEPETTVEVRFEEREN